jgi:hypothetical protein
MKVVKIALSCFLIVLMLYSIPIVRVVKANPFEGRDNTVWSVESPKNNTVYNRGG